MRGLVGRVYGDSWRQKRSVSATVLVQAGAKGAASRTVTGRGLIDGPSAGTGGHCYSRRLIS